MNAGLPAQTDLLVHPTKPHGCDAHPHNQGWEPAPLPIGHSLGKRRDTRGRSTSNGGETSRMGGLEKVLEVRERDKET